MRPFLPLAIIPAMVCLAQAPAPYSPEDRALLWKEAMITHDGMAYKYIVHTFPTRAEAEAFAAKPYLTRKNTRGQVFDLRYVEIPMALRSRIASLGKGILSEPLAYGGSWLMVELQDRNQRMLDRSTDVDKWLATYAATCLPTAQALRTDPELVARGVLNWLRTPADLNKALDSGAIKPAQLDMPTSSGAPLVYLAVIRKDPEFLEALLSHGASTEAPGDRGPLSVAVALQNTELIRILLAHKANPNGLPDNPAPILVAAANGDGAMMRTLLAAGADILATRRERDVFPIQNCLLYYLPDHDDALYGWARQEMEAALEKTRTVAWSAWIEQGGRRQPIQDGAVVTLKKAPFRIVMRKGPRHGFRIFTTEDTALAARMKEVPFRRTLLDFARIGAAGPDSTWLGVSDLTMKEGVLNYSATTQELAYSSDPERNRGVKRSVVKGKEEFTYEVTEFLFDDRDPKEVPIKAYAGPGLVMAAGLLPDLGRGADLYKPAVFRITFKP